MDRTLDQIGVGDAAELTWRVFPEDIDAFAALSGDTNPLHMDTGWAKQNGFRDRVAHGMLLGAKISALVGTLLPGNRCLLLDYEIAHPNPVYPGDDVTVRGKVRERWPELSVVEMSIKAGKTEGGKVVTVARGHVRCKVLS